MNFIRERYTQFCLLSFALTSGFGLLQALFPRFIGSMIGVELLYTFNARLMGLVVVVIGFSYVFALIYEEAKNPLLMVATMEKVLATLYVIVAVLAGQVSPLAAGMILVDGTIAILGIMAIRMPEEF